MNKVDADATLEVLADLLHPYLKTIAQITNGELKERIIDNIFNPILESNRTIMEEESNDEEEMAKKENYHRFVDGGKLPPKTVKEI